MSNQYLKRQLALQQKILKQGPPKIDQLSQRQLIKQQFYLTRFVYYLQNNTNLPTLPTPQVLIAIRQENQQLQESVQAFRSSTYENYLKKRLDQVLKQTQIVQKTNFGGQSYKAGYLKMTNHNNRY